MKLLLPGKKLRRQVVCLLEEFFDTHDELALTVAVQMLAEFYRLPAPHVTLHPKFAARIWGDCDPRGNIRLVNPETWQRKRSDNDAAGWAAVALHELAHWLFYVDAERKADLYATRFLEDVA